MKKNCPLCHKESSLSEEASFCPFCGQPFNQGGDEAAFIGLPVKQEQETKFSLGPYDVINSIGKGGMGEVLLAYDPICGRQLAVKRIRTDFEGKSPLRNRFLKEARITSQLTHPSIIPIYNIHIGEDQNIYYTMPFVEGKTLKQIFREARHLEKEGQKSDDIGGSIPALTRIFLNVCQAIAYAHSNNVLHRDIKPENVIVGKYGQVVILDWGLAKLVDDQEETLDEKESSAHLTNIGKVVGTIPFMAPERAEGNPATFKTDIYSLGVILYQILTLRYPFRRGTLKEFRKTKHQEVLHDPAEVAPYRDVPRQLSAAVRHCLAANPDERYESVDDLIYDLENFLEGRSEWFEAGTLDVHEPEHWEFQENVLIAENIAITRGTDVTDWVMLMISKQSFGEYVRIETRVKIGDEGHGIGVMLSVPEEAERRVPNDGFCIWLASDKDKNSKLVYSTIEVMQAPDVVLKRGVWYDVRIEMVDHNIYCYLNNNLQFSYISHLPRAGTHIGLLTRDADYTIDPITVSLGGQNVQVSCLAIPDSFLAHKDYTTALNEYRRIGYSFTGRAEGREAMFRAGVTLLEKAKNCKDQTEAELYFNESLEEFGKLHRSPGAPLEYLGKGLVYHALHDYDEEIKCYELACRRYPKHPLLPVLHDQVLYRMHESSRYHPKATYAFILLALCHLPDVVTNKKADRLFQNLQTFWEKLPFIEEEQEQRVENFTVQLAYWLAKPHVLYEMLQQKELNKTVTDNAVYCLLDLGAWKLAEEHNKDPLIAIAIETHKQPHEKCLAQLLSKLPKTLGTRETRVLFHMLDIFMPNLIEEAAEKLRSYILSDEDQKRLDAYRIKAHLLKEEWQEAGDKLQNYPIEELTHERSLLYFLYGCWLTVTEGKEISDIHYSSVLPVAYPRSWTLGAHYIKGDIYEGHSWFNKAFHWDMRQLYDQLMVYTHCSGDQKKFSEMKEKRDQALLEPDPFEN